MNERNTEAWGAHLVGHVIDVKAGEVVRFFVCDQAGIGPVHGEYRNLAGLREMLSLGRWRRVTLSQDAFEALCLPDGKRILLRNKTTIAEEPKQSPAALILKLPDTGDPDGASFGILDGNHRAQGYQRWRTENNGTYTPVDAYLGLS